MCRGCVLYAIGKVPVSPFTEKNTLKALRSRARGGTRSFAPLSQMPVQGERVQVGALCGADCIYNGQNGIIVDWSNDRGTVRIETGSRVGEQVDVRDKNLYPCNPMVDMMYNMRSARSTGWPANGLIPAAAYPPPGYPPPQPHPGYPPPQYLSPAPGGPPMGHLLTPGYPPHADLGDPAATSLSRSAGSSGKAPYVDYRSGNVDEEEQQVARAIEISLAEAAARQPSPNATPAAMARAPQAHDVVELLSDVDEVAEHASNEPPTKKPKVKAEQPTGAMPLRPSTRKALVVGINTYSTRPLRCCINDASAVHAALQRMGYASTLVTDCDIDTLLKARRTFVDTLQKNDIAFFYFAGHGTEASVLQAGKPRTSNWLLARNVPESNSDLPRYALDAHNLLAEMEARGTRFNALVLDCCRDDPLPAGTRSLGSSGGPFNGLASMDPKGSLVAFACAPGARSIELPKDPHGIFTHHLLEHLETPGLEINKLFIRIGNAVEQATQHRPLPQRPFVNHCLRCEDASLFPIRQDVTEVGIAGGVGNSAQPDAGATGATGATMHA